MSEKLSKMEIALLIGGPCDGARVDIGQGVYEIKAWGDGGIQTYNRSAFHITEHGKVGNFFLFTHSSIPCNSIIAIQALIEGYRKPRKEDGNYFFDNEYNMSQLDSVNKNKW